MIEEELHLVHRDGEAEALGEGQFHVGHADDLAPQVEERAAGVAGIDLRRGLQIERALHLPGLRADDAFGDGAFESQRAADGEDAFAHAQNLRVSERDEGELRRLLVLDLQQREIGELVHGHDADLLVAAAFELAVALVVDLDGDLGLALDDVEIGDEVAVFVDEETGAEPAGRPHLHHRLPQARHEFTNGALGSRGAHRPEETALRFHSPRLCRRVRLRVGRRDDSITDAVDLGAWDRQHRVAKIDHDGILLLREDLAGDGGVLLQLDGRRRAGQPCDQPSTRY